MAISVQENINRVRSELRPPLSNYVAEALSALDQGLSSVRSDVTSLLTGDEEPSLVRIGFYPPSNSPYPSSIERILNEKLGEIPTVLDFGAKGDGQEVSDAAITIGTAALTSASGKFKSTDVGKWVSVIGAGAAGVPLVAKIAAFTSASAVTLSANAGTTVSNAYMIWGSDDSSFINLAISVCKTLGRTLYIPARRYMISSGITLQDANRLSISGHGPNSILMPFNWPNSTDVIDLSGSSRISLTEFTIDCRYLVKASRQLAAINGNGTSTNNTFGKTILRELRILNCQQDGIAFDINDTSHEVQDVIVSNCLIHDFGSSAYGAYPIAFIGQGTKRRVLVQGNEVSISTQPSATPLSAILVGNGKCYDVQVVNNRITGASEDGVQLYGRSTNSETVEFTGAVIAGNIIRDARQNGVACYGPSHCEVAMNVVINSGKNTGAASSQRNGIRWSWGITGASTKVASINVLIYGNTLVDDQVSHTMRYGLYLEHDAAAVHQGSVVANQVYVPAVQDITITPDNGTHLWFFLDGSASQATVHKRNPKAHFDVKGDIRTEPYSYNFDASGSQGLFAGLSADSGVSAGGSRVGSGFNVRFDGSNWVTGTDGSNSGAGAILGEYGSGDVDIFAIPSTGGVAQTISNAGFNSYRRIRALGAGGVKVYGSLNLDYATASRVAKIDGSKNLISGLVDLADTTGNVTGTLAIGSGGTNATTASGARTNLDVYSKAEIDSALSTKAAIGTYTTTTVSSHEHEVTLVA